MTNKLLSELHTWAVTAQEVKFDDAMRVKLGPSAPLGEENARYLQAYVFHYRSLGNIISGYLVVPRNASSRPLPVIIYNRGGTKDFGLIRTGMLFKHIAEIARWGYVVIGSQYPGNSVSEGKDDRGGTDVQSVADLYPLIQKLSIADEKRVGMYGESRGGMVTYICLTKVNWVKAAVSLAGVADLVREAKIRPEMQGIYAEAFGGDEEGKKQRSAVYWPEKFPDNTPLLLMHGTADRRVSPLDSIDLAVKLYEYKKPFSLMVFSDGDHGLTQYKNEWQEQAKKWFDKHLKE